MPSTPPPCPKCGSADVKELETYEDAYGVLVTAYQCNACTHEWEKK